MTFVWILLAALAVTVPLAFLVARAQRVSHNPHSLGGGSTPAEGDPPAADGRGVQPPPRITQQGDGAHPGSAGHDTPPCVEVPPQGVPRPNRHYRPDPDYGTYRAMRDAQLRFMAEQVEATTYGDEVQ